MARLELMDTIELMGSSDYHDRFVAEYIQLKIRYEKLKAFNTKIEAARRTGSLDEGAQVKEPEHDCPAGLLREQQAAMGEYLHLLEVRAVIEDIDLEDVKLWLENKKGEEHDKESETNSVVDERATVAVPDTDDEWELLSEVIGKIIERGLVADADEEKLMAAGLNVLHKVRVQSSECKDESTELPEFIPNEIKRGLEACSIGSCSRCPLRGKADSDNCINDLMNQALKYIRKLEKERT